MVGMEGSDSSFQTLAKITGPNNSFLKHIETTSGAKVQLRGIGSGTLEPPHNRGTKHLYIYRCLIYFYRG